MATAGLNRRFKRLITFPLLVALGLLALACAPSSSSQGDDAPGATASNQIQDPPGYIHGLPIGEADVGHQVGKYVPEFALGLLDGTTITATDLVNEGRPTFLFFWATT